MSETKEPEIQQENPEERQKRLRRQSLKRQRMRQRQRKALLMRAALAAVVLILVIIIVAVVAGTIKKGTGKKKTGGKAAQDGEEVAEMEAVDLKQTLHLSVMSLIADTDLAFGQEDTQAAEDLDQSRLTVEEFNLILQQLYDNGYVLISMEDIASVDEDGALGEMELMLPKGKKPLIISQQNLNYDLEYTGQGIAAKLIVDESGKPVCEVTKADGSTTTGAYDVVPCIDDFIAQHPDFSHDGARGILGLTGYNGILGYRTEERLASSDENKYASRYGVFDTTAEIEAAAPVISALKSEGWEFACNGYAKTGYTSDLDTVKKDIESWKSKVGNLIGETDILLYPFGTDIGSWNAYSADDEKYEYLKSQGFKYFSAMDLSGRWMQMTDEYLRCNYQNLDGYRMYQELYQNAGRFTGILDFTSIYDQKRPSVPEAAGEQPEGEQT
jgi:hypothetical protein